MNIIIFDKNKINEIIEIKNEENHYIISEIK